MPDQMMSDKSVVEALQELAVVCRDTLAGYRDAAMRTADRELKSMLEELTRQRQSAADGLDQLVRDYGGEVGARAAKVGDAVQRLFNGLRGALSGDDRAALLGEMARLESYAEAAFDRVKRLDLSDRARELVDKMHDGVKQSRDRMRQLAGNQGSWVAERSVALGKRSIDTVGHYVGDNPLTGSVIALGAGFLIGALVMAAVARGRGNGGARGQERGHERGDGARGSSGTYDPSGRAYGDQDVSAG